MPSPERPANERSTCPPQESLVLWQEGRLSEDDVEGLLPHLNSCPDCQKLVELLLAADPFSQLLRQPGPTFTPEECARVDHIICRVKELDLLTGSISATTKVVSCEGHFPLFDKPQAADEIGRVGEYRVLRLLGHGGMGLVFQAEDTQLRRSVALKVIRPEVLQKPGSRERFLREARGAASIRHERVVTIHRVGETNGVPYLVMELLEGQSLEAVCRNGTALSLAEVLRIGRQIAEGLAAVHDKGLIHRDVKPHNIWLEGPSQRVKLLDFSLARAADDAAITQNGHIVGTVAYMPPEQARGESVDVRADLFSLGCVLYQLTTGQLPFEGRDALSILHALANVTPSPLSRINPAIPESLSRLVAALLARSPEERPRSAAEVVRALAAIAEEQGSTTEEQRPEARGQRPSFYWLGAGLLVLGLGILGMKALPSKTGSGEVPGHNDVSADIPDVPADALQRSELPAALRDRAPPELVAVLGGVRHFPISRGFHHFLLTRFSPDGKLVASIADREVCVYEVATGKVLWRFAQEKECGWFDFRRDSKVLAVSSRDGIELFDLTDGKSISRWTGHAYLDRCLSFTPDGRSLVSTDADGKARLWDVAERKVVRVYEPPEEHRFFQAPQVHRDGRFLALHAAGPKPTVLIVDLHTGATEKTFPGADTVPGAGGSQYQCTMRFSPDGETLATVRPGENILLWQVGTWKQLGTIEGDASILSFSADGRTLLRSYLWNGSAATEVRVEDVPTRSHRGTLTLPFAGDLAWGDLSPDGRTIAYRTGCGNMVGLFDAASGQERFPYVGHRGIVNTVAVSPDGAFVLSAGTDQRVLLWDLRTGGLVRELFFHRGCYGGMEGASFSPDGKWAAALRSPQGGDGWLRLWDPTSGREERNLSPIGHEWQRLDVAFHPKGGYLLSPHGKDLQLWNLESGSVTTWTEKHTKNIQSLAWSPDGHRFAAGDDAGLVSIWDALLRRPLEELRAEGGVCRVRYSPDGRQLAATTTGPDAALYLWDLPQRSPIRRQGHSADVGGLAWRPDGQAVATASTDGTVCVWPRDPKAAPQRFRLSAGQQGQLAFTPEGRHLVTANGDGSIFVLRLVAKKN